MVGCRQAQRSHHLLYKILRTESKELFPFLDRVDVRGNSLQYMEIASLAVLPLLQLFFLSAGVTKHRADSCMRELAWNMKCMEPLYNILAKTCLVTSNLRTYSNALWHREKICMKNPVSLPYKNCFKKEYGVFEKNSARTAEHISQVSSPSVHTSWLGASTHLQLLCSKGAQEPPVWGVQLKLQAACPPFLLLDQ